MGSTFSGAFDGWFGGDPAVAAAVAADVLGKDIFFDGNRHVAPNGDYATIAGIENYRRSLLRRLVTSPNEWKMNPGYGAGLRAYLKKPINASTLDEIKNKTIDHCLRDRRTDRVLDCVPEKIIIGGDTALRIYLRVQTIGRDLRFNPFLIADDPAKASLAQGVR